MSTIYTNSYWSKPFTYGLERSVKLSGSAGKTVRKIKTVSFIIWCQDQSSKMYKDQIHTTKLIHLAWLGASWGLRACAVWHFCGSTAVRVSRLARIACVACFADRHFGILRVLRVLRIYFGWCCVYCVHCVAYTALRILQQAQKKGEMQSFWLMWIIETLMCVLSFFLPLTFVLWEKQF